MQIYYYNRGEKKDMTLTETIISENLQYFVNKNVLEFACGEAPLGFASAKVSKSVLATDVEHFRINKVTSYPENFSTKVVDARKIHDIDYSPDTLICFNGIGHMSDILDEVIDSVIRILTNERVALIFNSWKMDKNVAENRLLPLLDQRSDITYEVKNQKKYQSITIKKQIQYKDDDYTQSNTTSE